MAELVPHNSICTEHTDQLFQDAVDGNLLPTNEKDSSIETVSTATDSENIILTPKISRSSSKIILQNMEEVLDSVKKQHRQKHRRRKEQKRLVEMEQMNTSKNDKINKARDTLSRHEKSGAYDNVVLKSSKTRCHNHNKKHCTKKPLQEQQIPLEESQSKDCNLIMSPIKSRIALKSDSKHSTMLPNSCGSPKAKDERGDAATLNDLTEPSGTNETKSSKLTTNAFEVMMNARNKSIGSNTPGKESSNVDGSPNIEKPSTNVQRKLMLQSWADRKGGLKRKINEEMRAAYVDEQLERRAKKFRKMLTSTNSPQSSRKMRGVQTKTEVSLKPTRRSKRSISQSPKFDITETTEQVAVNSQTILDAETEDFLSKLSSPTKKRDSLLGYFSKVTSPKDIISSTTNQGNTSIQTVSQLDVKGTCSPKRRGRKKKLEVPEILNAQNISQTVNTPETPSARPKRSCVGKAKYDYDLELEDKKQKNEPTKYLKTRKSLKQNQVEVEEVEENRTVRASSRRKSKSLAEPEIINLDETSFISNIEIDGVPKKLAPLFTRNMPKPSPDPYLMKARQEFLRSGVPEKLKLEQEKLKQIERIYEDSIEIFPKLSHLHQLSEDEFHFFSEWNFKNDNLKFKIKDLINLYSDDESESKNSLIGGRKSKLRKSSKKGLIGITCCTTKDFSLDNIYTLKNGLKSLNHQDVNVQKLADLPIISNKRQIVKSWKSEFDRFPTYKCYNQLRAKYRFFSALDSGQDTEQVSESFVVTRSTRRSVELANLNVNHAESNADDVKPSELAPNGELLFAEKYKPMLLDQVLVNLTPITQLREFLANWASCSGSSSIKNSQNLADDSMDYLNDSNSNTQMSCNSVVLLGPTASGKTNAVFTLANELNFNVLEINAGMKRTGKKLLQELQEATQSHQIRKDSNVNGGSVKSKGQKNLLRLSLNDLKGKKLPINKASSESSSSDTNNELTSRKCLILIEDADIVFEQTDAGFTDAIYSLAASSKRPVIVVANNPNCLHLQRLISQNTIKFSAPNPLSISKYLAVLSLMENCPVSLDDLISLYLFNRQDLRKTIHELQFFIQSGGDRKSEILGNYVNLENDKKNNTPKKKIKDNDINLRVCNNGDDIVTEIVEKSTNGQFFASPTKKRLLSLDSSHSHTHTQKLMSFENDEKLLKKEISLEQKKDVYENNEKPYIHKTLFEFYTVDQNEKLRIPFPVNFDLLRINLRDIFMSAKNFVPETKISASTTNSSTCSKTKKRETRSPKKVWLNAATISSDGITTKTNENKKNMNSVKGLKALHNFYDNISIASLLMTRDEYTDGTTYQMKQQFTDRLKTYDHEHIAHDILERSINVNLDAEMCPYNLFQTPKKMQPVNDFLGSIIPTNNKRIRSMDYEPLIREICRSEKDRATQERRSTRFYHYLRNSNIDVGNFSQQRPFDIVCDIFSEESKQNETNLIQTNEL